MLLDGVHLQTIWLHSWTIYFLLQNVEEIINAIQKEPKIVSYLKSGHSLPIDRRRPRQNTYQHYQGTRFNLSLFIRCYNQKQTVCCCFRETRPSPPPPPP